MQPRGFFSSAAYQYHDHSLNFRRHRSFFYKVPERSLEQGSCGHQSDGQQIRLGGEQTGGTSDKQPSGITSASHLMLPLDTARRLNFKRQYQAVGKSLALWCKHPNSPHSSSLPSSEGRTGDAALPSPGVHIYSSFRTSKRHESPIQANPASHSNFSLLLMGTIQAKHQGSAKPRPLSLLMFSES